MFTSSLERVIELNKNKKKGTRKAPQEKQLNQKVCEATRFAESRRQAHDKTSAFKNITEIRESILFFVLHD